MAALYEWMVIYREFDESRSSFSAPAGWGLPAEQGRGSRVARRRPPCGRASTGSCPTTATTPPCSCTACRCTWSCSTGSATSVPTPFRPSSRQPHLRRHRGPDASCRRYRLAFKLRKEDRAVLCFFGDAHQHRRPARGHELRRADESPGDLLLREQPVGDLRPAQPADRRATLAQKAIAYGMPGLQVDGNDLFAVLQRHAATPWPVPATDRGRRSLRPSPIGWATTPPPTTPGVIAIRLSMKPPWPAIRCGARGFTWNPAAAGTSHDRPSSIAVPKS